ncbi:hypothetical protein CAOG_009597 [Capsaspora owczarzaki ATCC 30864]|uniref:anthranilate phosphoribosyltransferase n=1 Tax=Capsaspora owczarzaki (strain ATCC 30864) TaxID=595528 RepID=A0A0D2WNA1_CAPO3|nr:hypothetical protein CAOG_009597 [Capsaspora owczarzaki ATCC 30864]
MSQSLSSSTSGGAPGAFGSASFAIQDAGPRLATTASNKTLLIDNYDSFTWNIYQYLCELGANVSVIRNDAISLQGCIDFNPTHLVISPGPGHPSTDSGISCAALLHFAGKIPILGVCLGHQAMFEVFGGKVIHAGEIRHGKTSTLHHDGKGLYLNVTPEIQVIRYHSLAGDRSLVPESLIVSSRTDSGVIMGVRHREYVCEGVQFHPESIKSEEGMLMMRNFLSWTAGTWSEQEQKQQQQQQQQQQSTAAAAAPSAAPIPTTTSPAEIPAIPMRECVKKLADGSGPVDNLDIVRAGIQAMLTGSATPAQVASFLLALRFRGHTPTVVAACAEVMSRHALRIDAPALSLNCFPDSPLDVVDIVGTGGDGLDTFNVSTAAGIVASACGVRVAKHGNRSASSLCGAADLIEACGANLELDPAAVASILQSTGFCFLFSQRFHPAMRHVAPVRKEIGTKTIFNILGPMSSPARPRALVVGVFSPEVGRLMADALALRGVQSALVVHGQDGLDEISPAVPTTVWRLRGSRIEELTISPADFGLPLHALEEVVGSHPQANAATLFQLLEGKIDGAILDFVTMNASALLVAAGAAADFKAGVAQAKQAIASGRALQVLQQFITESVAARRT